MRDVIEKLLWFIILVLIVFGGVLLIAYAGTVLISFFTKILIGYSFTIKERAFLFAAILVAIFFFPRECDRR